MTPHRTISTTCNPAAPSKTDYGDSGQSNHDVDGAW
eukprot:CAMPEP_0174364864 /NCGR_PEP_ID=MMETSP0811_2-20130205/74829_1 /TAXON_ID=73025 ORGANISM="Eutreptiella gymnastica-like, Strain CCMP1594" /NCGR_SAMPLE_ID=MMETSP0811_2 /ASSEMBLY_ACC=CAM_ASM_000667 /LENGTH=35 /DNA_ID= /DNA_START= /DNA_END= /DNA_ORIENTATION=